jgi:D-alanyl-lipoteichoic acid acyltransferase DltB (MBOAT superfamily)
MATLNTEEILNLFAYQAGAPLMFNTGAFLLIFGLFYALYVIGYKHLAFRKWYVLAFSMYFYFKASGIYLLLLGGTIIFDYAVALQIEKATKQQVAKAWLIASILVNVALLGYFKYTNFLIDIFNFFWLDKTPNLSVFLPIGISFFTFQTISYKVDVYRKQLKATTSLLDYAFYITFFPHLVAGPIVRAKDFLYQINTGLILNKVFLAEGLYLIVKGLFKKAVVADYVAQYVDLVYANPAGFSGFENWMAMYAYTLQIFCDFSGYTDMAIGLAAIMGFKLCENFNSPYQATNITDFWRKWHISLSSWLRDYIYIPLGGNRNGKGMQQVNQLLTMLIGGLWHGASMRFIIWGGLHGLALVIHKLWSGSALGKAVPDNGFTKFIGWFITLHTVALLWILFRVPDLATAQATLQTVLETDFLTFWSYAEPFWTARPLVLIMVLGGFALTIIPQTWKEVVKQHFIGSPMIYKALWLIIVIHLSMEMSGQGVQPFIYFQF